MLAVSLFVSSCFHKWTDSCVALLLESISFAQYKEVFMENDMDGMALADVAHDKLKDLVNIASKFSRPATHSFTLCDFFWV